MAHVEKYKMAQLGIGKHYDRTYKNHSNEHIDPSRTHLNWCIANGVAVGGPLGGSMPDLKTYVQERYAQLPRIKQRKDAVGFGDMVVTAPDEVMEEDLQKFFLACYRWAEQRYGAENVMPAYIHMDETTPHMHLPVLPVTEDGRRNWDQVFPRREYQSLHKALNDFVDTEMGYHVSILLGEEEHERKALDKLDQKELDLGREKVAADREEALKEENRKYEKAAKAFREATCELQEKTDNVNTLIESADRISGEVARFVQSGTAELEVRARIGDRDAEDALAIQAAVETCATCVYDLWVHRLYDMAERIAFDLESKLLDGLYLDTWHAALWNLGLWIVNTAMNGLQLVSRDEAIHWGMGPDGPISAENPDRPRGGKIVADD